MSNNNLGTAQDTGFLPSSPEVDRLLQSLGVKGDGDGWQALLSSPAGQHLDDVQKSQGSKIKNLKRDFASVYSTPAGGRFIEAILDASLRRAPAKPGIGNLQEQTGYVLERQGQNSLATWILMMIHAGQNLPDPANVTATAKKSKRK